MPIMQEKHGNAVNADKQQQQLQAAIKAVKYTQGPMAKIQGRQYTAIDEGSPFQDPHRDINSIAGHAMQLLHGIQPAAQGMTHECKKLHMSDVVLQHQAHLNRLS
jgi:hypothetical protein